jgi:hypothetical protein
MPVGVYGSYPGAGPLQVPADPAQQPQNLASVGTSPGGIATQPLGNQGDPVAFIRQWQATHPASTDAPAQIAAALKAAGFNASPYMYGSTPSGNEISLNGQKFKVISGENSGTPGWYTGGDDSGGGAAGGGAPGMAGPLGNGLNGIPGGGDLNQYLPLPTGLTLENDPGYQARLKLGTDAIQNSAAAKGTLLSGKTLADLSDYGQTQASNEYGAAFERARESQGDVFGRNYSLANLGLQGANDLSNVYGTNAANQNGLVTNQANVNAANTINQGNSTAQSLADLAKAGLSAYYANKFKTPPTTNAPGFSLQ